MWKMRKTILSPLSAEQREQAEAALIVLLRLLERP